MNFPRLGFVYLAVACAVSAAQPSAAQAPDAVYALTALDVAPGQAAQGIAILKPYREAARKQSGNLGVDVLQEAGWPNRFVIYEAWRDRAAYEANEKAAPLAALRDKLKTIATAPYDRRDYQPVSIGAAKPASGAGAVYLQVHLDVFPPGIDKTLVALKELAEAARKGDGNLRFEVTQSAKAPTSHTTLLGAWASRKAYDEFEQTAYARRFRDTVGPLLGSPYDDRLYALID
jgi:quinol monooxygenase YgiN